jgi:hypothetical protein
VGVRVRERKYFLIENPELTLPLTRTLKKGNETWNEKRRKRPGNGGRKD